MDRVNIWILWMLVCGKIFADKMVFFPLFSQYDSREPRFVLETFQRIPYCVQYHGFVSDKTNVRFIFKKKDGSLFSLKKGEIKDNISIVEFREDFKVIKIKDRRENESFMLIEGQVTFYPNRFTGILRDKTNGKRYFVSEQQLEILNGQMRLLPKFDEKCIYGVECFENAECFAYILIKF